MDNAFSTDVWWNGTWVANVVKVCKGKYPSDGITLNSVSADHVLALITFFAVFEPWLLVWSLQQEGPQRYPALGIFERNLSFSLGKLTVLHPASQSSHLCTSLTESLSMLWGSSILLILWIFGLHAFTVFCNVLSCLILGILSCSAPCPTGIISLLIIVMEILHWGTRFGKKCKAFRTVPGTQSKLLKGLQFFS